MKKTHFFLHCFLLLLIQQGFCQGDTVPSRKVYTTSRATSAPKIDGILNDAAWENIPLMSENFPVS